MQPTVTSVVHGSSAEAVGVKVGDGVISVDGVPTTDIQALADRLGQQQIIGRPVALQLSRAGRTLTVSPVPVKACAYPAVRKRPAIPRLSAAA
ncbi:PDZ domain-containing protein [Ramlibacter sp. MMS24-I3-19]|uniref:PDZ domain-containing protein n=1 Tax=Ramlibacter sp. MMS24-I3-19 TaxID=3416606 RepID=UPI003D06DE8A